MRFAVAAHMRRMKASDTEVWAHRFAQRTLRFADGERRSRRTGGVTRPRGGCRMREPSGALRVAERVGVEAIGGGRSAAVARVPYETRSPIA